jgi:hypothetical protein
MHDFAGLSTSCDAARRSVCYRVAAPSPAIAFDEAVGDGIELGSFRRCGGRARAEMPQMKTGRKAQLILPSGEQSHLEDQIRKWRDDHLDKALD